MAKIPALISTAALLFCVQVSAKKVAPDSVQIKPYKANYVFSRNSNVMGEGYRSLSYNDGDVAEYRYETDIKWTIFSDRRQETTRVSIDNGIAVPSYYSFERSGTGRDLNYEWSYDKARNLARNIKKDQTKSLKLPDNFQTPSSYYVQLRLALLSGQHQKVFSYPVISSAGKVRNYAFEYDGTEQLELPYGRLEAIRFKREETNKRRVVHYWFAPDLDYMLVKVHQKNDDAEQFLAQLSSIEAP